MVLQKVTAVEGYFEAYDLGLRIEDIDKVEIIFPQTRLGDGQNGRPTPGIPVVGRREPPISALLTSQASGRPRPFTKGKATWILSEMEGHKRVWNTQFLSSPRRFCGL